MKLVFTILLCLAALVGGKAQQASTPMGSMAGSERATAAIACVGQHKQRGGAKPNPGRRLPEVRLALDQEPVPV